MCGNKRNRLSLDVLEIFWYIFSKSKKLKFLVVIFLFWFSVLLFQIQLFQFFFWFLQLCLFFRNLIFSVDVFLTTLQLVIVAIGVGANLAVIYATITRFSCKKASNLFVCTLACIDVLALLYDLGGITVSLCGGGSSCEFRPCIVTSMGNAVTFMSAFNLVLIAFDRYVTI